MNPLRIFLLAALILTASFPGCLDEDSTDSEEINKPVAKILSINPVNLTIGETVSFTGEGTTDEGYIIGYDWGSSLDGFLSDEKIFSISNLSIGNHTIFFKVQNDDKIWSDRAELNLTVNEVPNRPPEARILRPGQGNIFDVGEFFTIDGSLSSDPDDDELQYMWTLSGLGSPIDLSNQMSDSVMVDMPGDDLVLTLMVMDSGGLTSQDIVVINIEPGNRPPVASIITPSNGGSYSKGKEVTFNGMSSSDADNDPLTYVWELGEAGEPTYKASTEGKFSLDLGEGGWSVTLTVTDPDGESNFIKHSFSVTDLPPVASIKLDKTSVFTDEIIQFSGEDSYDPEGEALDFLWDFGDNKTSSLKSPQHSWDNAGMYQVTLTVIAEDQEGSETKNIEIKSLGPIAEFEFEDESGSEVEKTRSNANITLDGGDSSGPDGEIKEYRWNFGDGMERTTNESSTEYSWSAGGYYNVTLTVTDENDETGEIVKILQVVPEDYLEECQDSSPVAQDTEQNYNFNVEIFVS